MDSARILALGASFGEIKSAAYAHSEEYHGLGLIMHGIGMSDELPFIRPSRPDVRTPPDSVIEPGMVLCVEAYAGHPGGPQGVKLEEQVLVTETGREVLTQYPFEGDLLHKMESWGSRNSQISMRLGGFALGIAQLATVKASVPRR